MATLPRMPLAAPLVSESTCRSLYVGNLDPRVTEVILAEIFRASATGEVLHVKIIPDKNMQHGGLNYGFVDFGDHLTAEAAIQSLNGRKVFDREIKVNWAYQGSGNTIRQDISNHHHVFVGDLCPDITDAHLHQAFCTFGSLSHARVIHDLSTRKSRGYGFLAFRDRGDAERAIATMNGIWLGTRTIRVNWATQKTTNPVGGINTFLPENAQANMYAASQQSVHGGLQTTASPMLPYDCILNQCSPTNCTVYFGNLAPTVRETDIMTYFQAFGYVVELRHQPDRGYAFVRMDTHERAAMAIFRLQGAMLHGRSVKISWGKDKFGERVPGSENSTTGITPGAPNQYAMSVPQNSVSDSYDAYAQYYKQQTTSAGPGASYTYTTDHQSVAQPEIPVAVDSSSLPHLSDPIAAAAAAAAQAAVLYQQQQQKHQQQALSNSMNDPNNFVANAQAAAANAALAAAGASGSAESFSNEYYAYYYQYFYNQQQQQHQYQVSQGQQQSQQICSSYGEQNQDGGAPVANLV